MNRAAFNHKPKRLANDIFFKMRGPFNDYLWALAKTQDWYEDGVGYVGNEDGKFYFQIAGLTTGFACLVIDDELKVAYQKQTERLS